MCRLRPVVSVFPYLLWQTINDGSHAWPVKVISSALHLIKLSENLLALSASSAKRRAYECWQQRAPVCREVIMQHGQPLGLEEKTSYAGFASLKTSEHTLVLWTDESFRNNRQSSALSWTDVQTGCIVKHIIGYECVNMRILMNVDYHSQPFSFRTDLQLFTVPFNVKPLVSASCWTCKVLRGVKVGVKFEGHRRSLRSCSTWYHVS